MASIIIEKGRSKGKIYPLEDGKRFSFGRDPSCHIQFQDPLASRQHFVIYAEDGTYTLEDTSSRNGTFLNGARIKKEILHLGDQILAGDTLFSFISDEETRTRCGLVGQTLGGFEIIERLGRGGMGTVYLARQLSLNRQVAIKVLSPLLTRDKRQVDRFLREARAAGKLNHPHIVQVYDVGEAEGFFYYSMEYLPGGNMEDLLCFTDRILPTAAVAMIMDVARGLQYAESNGIVHRDIKPENLMLDEDNRVKIGDLGIALLHENEFADIGRVVGTAQYMSPEQARGKPVDHRSDIYSLGCTFYRMLTGRFPFTGLTKEEILHRQVTYYPPRVDKVLPDIPGPIADLVERMMAKGPKDRPQNATILLEELEKCLDDDAYRGPKTPVALNPVEEAARLLRLDSRRKSSRRKYKTRRKRKRQWFSGAFFGLGISLCVIAGAVAIAFPDMLRTIRPEANLTSGESSHPSSNRNSTKATSNAPAIADNNARARRMYLAARDFERSHPDDVLGAADLYDRIRDLFPGTRYGRLATQRLEALASSGKQQPEWKARWTETAKDAQRAIDAYRFGEAQRIFDTFAREFPNSPGAAAAQRASRQVRRLADRLAARYFTQVDKSIAGENWEEARKLCEAIIGRWGIEPHVTNARNKLAQLESRRRFPRAH